MYGSFTNRNIGIENTAHQTATDINESLIAVAPSAIPNNAGFKYINTFIANNTPPPIYPRENPSEETKSTFFSEATPVIRES